MHRRARAPSPTTSYVQPPAPLRWRLLHYELTWADVRVALPRVWQETGRDNLGLVSAGAAFYAMLALFPGLAAAVSIYGLAADPISLGEQISKLSNLLPSEAWALIQEQLTKIIMASGASLGIGAIAGLAFAIWSASQAVSAMMMALNIVYGVEETRGFFRRIAIALGLTFGTIVFIVLALLVVVALPTLFKLIGQENTTKDVLNFLRWPLIAAALLFGVATLYKLAPSVPDMKWRWITPGGLLATFGFLVVSVAFSKYVANFAHYNETYGSVGAVVALLMWLYFTSYVVLIGAELNAELDRQTGLDSAPAR